MRLRPEYPLAARGGTITAWLAMFVLAAVMALTWFGYRAANEWQSNAAQLTERRQQQVAVSFTLNLVRDMRAVQATVIDRRQWDTDELDSPKHLAEVFAPVFRRYAYPEVFFASRLSVEPTFLARESRLPSWATAGSQSAGIRWFTNPDVAALLRSHVLQDVGSGRQYSIFRLEAGGTEYQVVTRFLRGASDGNLPVAVLGFLVNMDWARARYFVPMLDGVMVGAGAAATNPVRAPTRVQYAFLDQT